MNILKNTLKSFLCIILLTITIRSNSFCQANLSPPKNEVLDTAQIYRLEFQIQYKKLYIWSPFRGYWFTIVNGADHYLEWFKPGENIFDLPTGKYLLTIIYDDYGCEEPISIPIDMPNL